MTRPGIQFRLSPVQLLFSHRIWMAGMQESVPHPPASDPKFRLIFPVGSKIGQFYSSIDLANMRFDIDSCIRH